MAKTLNQFLEQQAGYLKVKNPDEQKFVDKHVVVKHPDRNGNGDEVFNGSKVKKVDRRKERHGYEPGEDEKVYEELKGNQHKIDANKNGKVDAHDFKLLRKKKKVAEEAEQIDELSTPTLQSYRKKARAQGNAIIDKMKMGGGDWSKDQKDTKTLRKRAAGAQASGKQLVKRGESLKTEEVEELEELSKATLGSYVKKAKTQMSRSDTVAGRLAGERMKGGKPSAQEKKHSDRANKRYFGIDKAVDRLTKEEAEQIDEISTAAKDSYVKKAVKQLPGLFNKSGKDADAARKYYNRKNTVRKIANEEVEQVDEKINLKKASMGTVVKDFQKSDAPQFKGKSQEKRRVMAIAAKLTAERGGKPLRKEERLAQILTDLSESHKNTMLSVFNKLNEDNQKKFLQACETEGGIERMLDFSISHRGE